MPRNINPAEISSMEESIPLSGLVKQELLLMEETSGCIGGGVRYSENLQSYSWGKPMMRMMLELQCVAVAIIVTTQVSILIHFGIKFFEKLVGGDIALPMLYLAAIVMGTLCFVRPTYWRIVLALIIYSLTAYYSMMAVIVAMDNLLKPGEALQENTKTSKVWVPWAIGMALHLQIGLSSIAISFISARDMFRFKPLIWSGHSPPQVILKTPSLNNNNEHPGNRQFVI